MTRRIGYIFGALAHSLCTRNSLDPQDTEAWKYYYNLRFKQTSTKNSGPGSLLMQVLQKKKLVINKRSGAVVMSLDSEGLGAAVVLIYNLNLYVFVFGYFLKQNLSILSQAKQKFINALQLKYMIL